MGSMVSLPPASGNSNGLTVCVVIVNFNGAAYLDGCIASVFEQSFAAEVIVVDNGSTDGSVSAIQRTFPTVRFTINARNVGFARGANQGAQSARSDFILFLNNDARLEPGSLSVLVGYLASHRFVGACQPRIIQPNGELDNAGSFLTRSGFLYHVSTDDLMHRRFAPTRFALKGACLLVRAPIFRALGGFDESYFAYLEDTDLCWRLLRAGWELHFVSEATVLHDGGRTTRAIFASPEIDYLAFRNRITTIRKNEIGWRRLLTLAVHGALCCGVAAAFAATGKWRNAGAIVRALWWHLRNRVFVVVLAEESCWGGRRTRLVPPVARFTVGSAFGLLRAYLRRW